MPKYKYEIYYNYDGPTASDPFAKEKSEQEVQDALLNFKSELPVYLDAKCSILTLADVATNKNKKIFTIETTAKDDEVYLAVDKCLRS